jgi:hypothetical protein
LSGRKTGHGAPVVLSTEELKRLTALNLWLRTNSKRSPWKALVPDFVTAFTAALECTPLLAVVELVSSRNSCRASGNGSGRFRLS